MNVNIMSTQGIGARQGIKCAIYGKAGRGKTMLAMTAPNPMIISAEGGLLSLSRFNLPYAEVKTVADLENLRQFFTSSQQARQFQTVYIDSVSEIAEVVLSNARGLVKDPRMAYSELLEKMTAVIRGFRDLQGYNVVMTAKQSYNVDSVTGITMNAPALPGKQLNIDFPYFFDELFQLDIGAMPDGTQYRFLRCQPDMNNEAKDRSGALAAQEEPHLGKIFHKINQTANQPNN